MIRPNEAGSGRDASAPEISVLISTRNRGSELRAFLTGLEATCANAPVPTEIILIDNGSTDTTPTVLNEWEAGGLHRQQLTVSQPGKSRALNRAMKSARGQLFVFTDDDVVVPVDWIASIHAFFTNRPDFAGAMGRVLPPPEEATPEILRLVAMYPGIIPLFDAGDDCCDLDDMYGCNMAIRREAFAVIGGFNESLGPGALGYCDDTDIAIRLRNAGMRVGYMPRAVVFHRIDRARLTPAAFHEFQVRCARGRFVIDPTQSWVRNALRACEAFLSAGLSWCQGNAQKRARALGRLARHRELVRLHFTPRAFESLRESRP